MITLCYAGILGLILVALSIHVIKGRRQAGTALGSIDNLEINRRIRAQANFTEYTPLFLILLAGAEYASLAHSLLHLFGIAFVAGRCMHAYSLLQAEQYDGHKLINKPIWRIRAMKCTFFTIGSLSIINILLSITLGMHAL